MSSNKRCAANGRYLDVGPIHPISLTAPEENCRSVRLWDVEGRGDEFLVRGQSCGSAIPGTCIEVVAVEARQLKKKLSHLLDEWPGGIWSCAVIRRCREISYGNKKGCCGHSFGSEMRGGER